VRVRLNFESAFRGAAGRTGREQQEGCCRGGARLRSRGAARGASAVCRRLRLRLRSMTEQVVVLAQYIFVASFCGCPALPVPPYLGRIVARVFFLPRFFWGERNVPTLRSRMVSEPFPKGIIVFLL